MKKIFIAACAVAAIFLPLYGVSAAQFAVPSDESGNVFVGSGSYKNLYTAGGNVSVNSNIAGDLFVGGGAVTVIGQVEQDAFAGGGTVVLMGNVGGDARVAGGNITINAPVAGDLLAAGGTVTVGVSSTIGQDLLAAGGSVTVNGPVGGYAKLAGDSVYINNVIAGNLDVHAQKLTFGPLSKVTGRIVYTGKNAAVVDPGATVGSIEYNQIQTQQNNIPTLALFTGGFVIGLIALLIAAFIFMRFGAKGVQSVMNAAYKSPWSSLGIGFLGLIVTPVLVIILAVTLVGYFAALLVVALFVLMMLITSVLSTLFIGSVIFKWIKKTDVLPLDWKTVLVGVVLYKILFLIPVLGWFACFIVYVMVFGALLTSVKSLSSSMVEKKI